MNTNQNIQKLKDKTFVISATVNKDKIAAAHNQVIEKAQKEFKTAGFRPGKAPLDVVKQNADPKAVLEEVIQTVLSENYAELLKENDLHPIVDPQVKIITTPLDYDKDWEVEYKCCELPEVKLDEKAFEEIKKLEDRELNKMFDILVANAEIELPEMLKEKEKEWKINLIIDKIASLQNLEVSSEEVRQALETNPELAQNINLTFYLMRQQKVINYLSSLK